MFLSLLDLWHWRSMSVSMASYFVLPMPPSEQLSIATPYNSHP